MRVLIFGRRGYLAQAFEAFWKARGWHTLMSTADVTHRHEVGTAIRRWNPEVALNAAGKTHGARHANIDGCEVTLEARTITAHTNLVGGMVVRDECAREGLPLIHLGSGCVFDGAGPFTEFDRPNPRSWYAQTKAIGDIEVARYEAALVVRFRMPFSGVDHPRNLLTKLRRYAAVVDAPNSVIEVDALVSAVDQLIDKGVRGVVHIAHPDPISPYLIAARWGAVRLTPAALDALTLAPRSNAVLSTEKLQALGVRIGPAHEAIERCLAQLGVAA